MNFNFDNIEVITQHCLQSPVLVRVNQHQPSGDSEDVHWGHSDGNRFSLGQITQTYLGTSFDVISEATPWRNYLFSGTDVAKSRFPDDTASYGLSYETVCSLDELRQYFASYIVPKEPCAYWTLWTPAQPFTVHHLTSPPTEISLTGRIFLLNFWQWLTSKT